MKKIGSSRASPRRADYFWLAAGPVIAAAIAIAVAIAMSIFSQSASAATGTVDLGTAGSYAVLAGSTVTNTGPSVISGDLGVSPGTAVTGFGGAPNGTVINGSIHAGDAAAASAQAALTTAYNDAAGRVKTMSIPGFIGAGHTLGPGVYNATSSLDVGGTLTLNGDSSAVFIFQASSTLVTDTGTTIKLAGGAQACNVFWQVGSSATLNSGSTFVGTVLASTAISVGTGDTIMGRVLASTAAVTLDDDTITAPTCATGGSGGSSSPRQQRLVDHTSRRRLDADTPPSAAARRPHPPSAARRPHPPSRGSTTHTRRRQLDNQPPPAAARRRHPREAARRPSPAGGGSTTSPRRGGSTTITRGRRLDDDTRRHRADSEAEAEAQAEAQAEAEAQASACSFTCRYHVPGDWLRIPLPSLASPGSALGKRAGLPWAPAPCVRPRRAC